MYARYRFVQYAAICHYHPFVYMSGVPDWVRPCHRVIEPAVKAQSGEQCHVPTAVRERPSMMQRSLGGAQGQSIWLWKMSPLQGFEPWTIHPVHCESLYQLRSPGRPWVCVGRYLSTSQMTRLSFAFKVDMRLWWSRVACCL